MVIPKEKLSAYQRWELASFGDDRPSAQQAAEATATATKQTAEQIAKLREQAQQQGYDEGHAEGYAQGRAAGLEAGRVEAARAAQRMQQIADAFGSEVARVDEALANDVLELALNLAKAMLKTALKVRPELVLPIVSEAIRYLPNVQQPALLILHPHDAELVRSHMADELAKAGWRVSEDPQMEPGGCHIETASNQIEASPAIRWQRIADALGKQSDWIE